jgi:hypothetical protein
MTERLLYLAVADARGHLMRAHLVSQLLAPAGVAVDVVTTSRDGQDFLAGLGTPSQLISDGFRILFRQDHRLSPGRTERRVLRYLLGRRARADLDHLATSFGARGARLLVVDSLHPAVLAAPLLGRPELPVVHVYGANLLEATREHVRRRLPGPLSRWFEGQLERALGRAVGCVVHTLDTGAAAGSGPAAGPDGRVHRLLAPPRRSAAEVRAMLGLASGERLAALYLNPHLDDLRLAAALERALATAGYRWYGVSEPFAGRPGWVAVDGRFTDVAAASDLVVSGAGMAACGLVQACRVPFLALIGQQPEQQRNLVDLCAHRAAADPAIEAVALGGPEATLHAALTAALQRIDAGPPPTSHAHGFEATARRWRSTFLELMALAQPQRRRPTHDHQHEQAEHHVR